MLGSSTCATSVFFSVKAITSTNIAVLFLDSNFRIRRYTPSLSDLIDVIPGDLHRPLADLARKFTDPTLDHDVARVLEGGAGLA